MIFENAAGSVDATVVRLLGTLSEAAAAPLEYVARWKRRTGRKAVGVLPMNFPLELVHAAGALPSLVQESSEAITDGRSLIYEFYCAYSRSLADQGAKGRLDVFDAIYAVDHCVALLGALDALRFAIEDRPIHLAQFPASMDEPASRVAVRERIAEMAAALAALTGTAPSAAALADSIALYNRDRALMRKVMDMRRAGTARISARQMQAIVQSAMVMDVAEHIAIMEQLVPALAQAAAGAPSGAVRLFLSGHYCHAPRPEVFDMIESCGVSIADDDLFTGYRFIATDVDATGDPLDALTDWYFNRNVTVPCGTRAQKTVDGADTLLTAIEASGSQAAIILLPKFCEPHMLYFPEIRKALLARDIPFLLIETEHEGLALEMLKTRVEALVETMKRGVAAH
ncbi:2-hydroxyacyl-CoA dehydratase subunit D [Novosphingobium colocasiae]|nr:2-hydroxyacyl-CoA dehydratase family protein [Novosphingobium colocasiae]